MHPHRDRIAGGHDAVGARSRIAKARETVRSVKAVAALGAVGTFFGAIALAQHGHPGANGGAAGGLQAPARFEERLAQDGFFGNGDIGPPSQSAAPRAATHTS